MHEDNSGDGSFAKLNLNISPQRNRDPTKTAMGEYD